MRLITQYIKLQDEVEKLKDELSSVEWQFKNSMDEMKVGVTHSGGSGDGEAWNQWWVFPSTMTDGEVDKALVDLGVGEHYNGSGQSFSHHYTTYRQGSRILVHQNGGLDI